MAWVRREIKDQEVQHPYRYELVDITSGEVFATYDIEPDFGEVLQEGTAVNAELLQRYEDYLVEVQTELGNIGLQLVAVNTWLNNIDQTISTLAPLANPVLTNPTTNTPEIGDNSTRISNTEWVTQYFEGLMAEYRR